jgi:L-alanine-DL-glutamate epimerase-like enolase superfamily enzyme
LPESPDLPVSNWVGEEERRENQRYGDLQAFLSDAGELAKDLLAEGITGMKIWPLDPFAEASGGHSISAAELRQGVEPFAKVRDAVGDKMDLMVELHSKWDLPNAIKIARGLEEFEPCWFEDPLRMDCVGALAQFCAATRIPTAGSETVATLVGFEELLQRSGVRIVLFDPAWMGGITEARKVIGLAEAKGLPVAPHDCSGPVNFVVGVHLTVSAANAFIQEGVRAFYRGWYGEVVTELPDVKNGYVAPLEGPGLGTELRPEVWSREDALMQSSELR